MSQRGFTVLEVLVAAMALALILIVVSSFYVSSVRFDEENRAQTFLQRQATFVVNELNKQIQSGTAATLTGPNGVGLTAGCPAYPAVTDANAVQVTNANDPTGTGCGATASCNYCFHRDASFTRLLEENPAGQRDLLAGAAATLSVATGGCPGSGGFCPTLLTNGVPAPVGVAVTLRLRYRYPETPSSFETMTFTTTIAARN